MRISSSKWWLCFRLFLCQGISFKPAYKPHEPLNVTAQKLKFSIKDFFSKCEQIHRNLGIWSHLLKKSLMENFNFCVVC